MTPPDTTTQIPPLSRWLTHVAFVLALAVVIARSTMLETLRDPFEVSPGSDAIPRGPGPGAGLVFDLLCAIPALLVLLRRLIDRQFVVRFSLATVLMALLGAWAALSVGWASDQFAAGVGAAHWIAGLSLLWAASQLVRSWLRLRLVAGVCFGLLLAMLAHGLVYRLVEVPDLRRSWEINKEQILRERGWEPDSFMARQFERKVISGEMVAFSASPNTLAALIVMLLVISLGAAVQRFVDKDELGWPIAILAAVPVAGLIIFYTQSKTAFATPLLAGALLAAAWWWAEVLARHRRTLFIVAVVMVLLGTVAVLGHGIAHNSLVIDSLTFRWKYWVGSWRLFTQHPMLGVGFANFGPHYLGVRLLEASEEIKDPHNFVVRFFTELGIVGGTLLLAWLARLWWDLTRPRTDTLLPPPRAGRHATTYALHAVAAIAVAGILLNLAASIDFSQMLGFVLVEVLKRLLWLGLIVIGTIVVSLRASDRQELDTRAAPWILLACTVALGVFLLHNLVDFSLFETGPMLVFALVSGAVLGMRERPSAPVAGTRIVSLVFSVAAIGWLASAALLVGPVIRATTLAYEADELLRTERAGAAAGRYLRAFHASPLPNSEWAYSAARSLMRAGAPASDVHAALEKAIAADPTAIVPLRSRAEFEARLPQPDIARFRADFDRLLALNPNDVEARLAYAEWLDHFGLRPEALEQYRLALRFNDGLSPEEPKRLNPQRRESVEARMRELSRLRDG